MLLQLEPPDWESCRDHHHCSLLWVDNIIANNKLPGKKDRINSNLNLNFKVLLNSASYFCIPTEDETTWKSTPVGSTYTALKFLFKRLRVRCKGMEVQTVYNNLRLKISLKGNKGLKWQITIDTVKKPDWFLSGKQVFVVSQLPRKYTCNKAPKLHSC